MNNSIAYSSHVMNHIIRKTQANGAPNSDDIGPVSS